MLTGYVYYNMVDFVGTVSGWGAGGGGVVVVYIEG